MKNIGLYIHFPFCKSKCYYCDFNSYAGKDNLQKEYVKALLKEIKTVLKGQDVAIDTIFIGGGTPSNMYDGAILSIINYLRKITLFNSNIEITIESNPNSISLKKVLEWKKAKINRISIGLQSANDEILKNIGRIHNVSDYKNSAEILKKNGFKNVNTDVMIGLPGQTKDNIKETLDLAKEYSTHISVYDLILEKNTPLEKMVKEKKVILPNEDEKYELSAFANKYLISLGYNRYEVSNYAKRGFECKHNLDCWSMKEYLGVGSGAHSFLNNKRFSNEKNIEKYIELINKLGTAVRHRKHETNTELIETFVMLGLRKCNGIDLEQLKRDYHYDILNDKKKIIEGFINNKLVELNVKTSRLKATKKGMNFLNKIILDLLS